jgi:hypothetical protein
MNNNFQFSGKNKNYKNTNTLTVDKQIEKKWSGIFLKGLK